MSVRLDPEHNNRNIFEVSGFLTSMRTLLRSELSGCSLAGLRTGASNTDAWYTDIVTRRSSVILTLITTDPKECGNTSFRFW
eukprot:gene4658-biopygen12726